MSLVDSTTQSDIAPLINFNSPLTFRNARFQVEVTTVFQLGFQKYHCVHAECKEAPGHSEGGTSRNKPLQPWRGCPRKWKASEVCICINPRTTGKEESTFGSSIPRGEVLLLRSHCLWCVSNRTSRWIRGRKSNGLMNGAVSFWPGAWLGSITS